MVLQYLSIHAEKTAAKAWMAAADMEMAKMREEEKAAAGGYAEGRECPQGAKDAVADTSAT